MATKIRKFKGETDLMKRAIELFDEFNRGDAEDLAFAVCQTVDKVEDMAARFPDYDSDVIAAAVFLTALQRMGD